MLSRTLKIHLNRFNSARSLCTLSPNIKKNINDPKERIRNIGLVAHIDAGKTTTTERMLYYSGSSEYMGEVHHGDTVMDFMEQERERGITITMAAATIKWLGFHINLLDTPGHVDFTFEVERSLSVLDGAVIILDGSVGVQAQTIKICQQVRRYEIPSLFYLNKMDKSSAGVDKCLSSVRKKLSMEPLLLQKPVFHDSIFTGLIDIVNGIYMEWPLQYQDRSGRDTFRQEQLLSRNSPQQFLDAGSKLKYEDQLQEEREQLISKLSDYDEQLADYVLSLENISHVDPQIISDSIRNNCLNRKLCPVLVGSSYRNIGVQPLLDSICHYLPSPIENKSAKHLLEHYTTNKHKPESHENLCALAFKIHYHPRLGLLTYLRIYSGSIGPSMSVFNLNRQSMEKITKIYRTFADRFVELKGDKLNEVTVGDIIAVSGLNGTITGDTLVHPIHEQSKHSQTPMMMAGIEIPEPVYYCSLECPSISKMKQLELALDHLQREDPSLRVSHDRDNQQIIIKGMGQLHIEIIKDRIKREYGVDVETGKLQISYKETVTKSDKASLEQSKTIGGQMNQVMVTLEIIPKHNLLGQLQVDVDLVNDPSSNNNDNTEAIGRKRKKPDKIHIKVINTKERNLSNEIRPWQLKAIHAGVLKAVEYGPLFAFPVVGIEVAIHDFQCTNQTSTAFISNIISHCVHKALKNCKPILLEPVMQVEIVTPEQYVGVIMSDLASRRSQLVNTNKGKLDQDDQLERYILAYVPLSEMFDYSTVLRTISSGMASFDMNLHSYQKMDEIQTAQIIKSISGIE